MEEIVRNFYIIEREDGNNSYRDIVEMEVNCHLLLSDMRVLGGTGEGLRRT